MILLSAYTEEYAHQASRLLASCNKQGVSNAMCSMQTHGSWLQNVLQKPRIMLRMLAKVNDPRVMWLDADAVVLRNPSAYFDEPWEHLSASVREPRANEEMQNWSKGKTYAVRAGTIFMRKSDLTMAVIEAWADLCDEAKENGEGRSVFLHGLEPMLWDACVRFGVEVTDLPREYWYINGPGEMHRRIPIPESAFICHHHTRIRRGPQGFGNRKWNRK